MADSGDIHRAGNSAIVLANVHLSMKAQQAHKNVILEFGKSQPRITFLSQVDFGK